MNRAIICFGTLAKQGMAPLPPGGAKTRPARRHARHPDFQKEPETTKPTNPATTRLTVAAHLIRRLTSCSYETKHIPDPEPRGRAH